LKKEEETAVMDQKEKLVENQRTENGEKDD
jgi:hypothetical protein